MPSIPAEPEDPLPSISYIPAEIIPYEEDFYTAFFYALDDEGYELEAGVMVTWNFGDGSKEETWPASQPPSHQYPTAGDVEYTVTSTFQIGEKNYRGECVVSFDDEGNLKGFDGPDTPADDDNPSQYFTKVADNGNNPLIISKFDNLEMQPAQLRVFLKVTGESPRNEYGNGVFIRKDNAAPRDIQIKGNQGIPAETIVLDFGLKTLDKYNGYSAYSEGQGFGYDDGTKFDIPFYYSAPWMTIPASGGTLDLGAVVIWDLQSTGIFGTGDFEHTTWAWKQEASITVLPSQLSGYDPQKHYPYLLVTIHATFTDQVNYSWKVSNPVFLDR
ncbi:MAG: PKD domain-containing protein [Bacteroidales bacterium]|nr:PKD domain-containing protein [Bacteroidales bacterium]